MELELHGQQVSKLDYDYTVAIHTDTGYEIRIEEDYTLTTPQGTHTYSPEPSTEDSGPLDILNEQTITAATANDTATLTLTVTDGTQLQVAASDDFEAWTLAGPKGRKIVCLPGGELATWNTTN